MKEFDLQEVEIKKITQGLKKVKEKLIDFKISNNSKLVIMRDGKIVKIDPKRLVK